MIKSTKNWQGYFNEITDYLDEFTIKCDECADMYRNYIYEHPTVDVWAIRVPGATRGHVKIEDGVVKEIKLYEDSFCYKREVLDNLNKFIGRKIDLE